MTRKRPKTRRCPLCGAETCVADVIRGYDGKVRYHVVCTGRSCSNRRAPCFNDCFQTEVEAVEDWNAL